jgi:hypothetical protein
MEGLNIIEGENITKNEPVLKYQNSEQPISVSDYGGASKDAEKIEEIRRKIDALENKPKKSSISRIVGKIPEEKKQELLKQYEDIFFDQQREEGERKKTPEELEIMEMVNQTTNEILTKYGLPHFDIPPENNHVIHEQSFENETRNGEHNPGWQKNTLRERVILSSFMEITFHENLHFKSYQDWQILKNEQNESQLSRMGFMLLTRDEGKILFRNLNEAVTEAMTKKYASKLFSHPLFKKEQEETRKAIAEQPAGSFYESEQFYIHKKINIRNIKNMLLGKPEREYSTEAFVYPEERLALAILIRKLFIKNPGKFKDEDEIMEMFEKAMLTGNINSVGKLIDKTFPKKNPEDPEEKGTFRQIGELGEDTEGLSEFVNAL